MPASPLPPPPLAPSRGRAVLLIGAIFVFFFSAYTFTASADFFSTGDTIIRIEVAENILGRWSIDLHGWKLEYPKHIKKEYLDPRVSTGRLGKTYSTYLPGQPLVIIPFDWIAGQLAIHERWPYGPTVLSFDRQVGPLFGALEVTVFAMFALRLGYGLRRSLLLSLVLGFASSVWPDEQSVLEHTEVAFFLLLAMYLAFRFREQGRSWLYLLLSGAAVGGAVITRYQDAFLGALAIGFYLLLPGGRSHSLLRRAGHAALLAVGILPFVGVDLWYDWVRFGSALATGHHETVFGYPIWLGAAGLVLSPGKGILWYCPILFLLVLAGPRFVRRWPALSLAIAALAAGFILLYGYVTYWHGDPAWGPRYIIPAIPFLVLPLGEIFHWRVRSAPLLWAAVLAVVGISFTIQVAAVSVSEWRTWYRVISYEENQGHKWQWIAARYRYFWDPHESPLYFQLHGLYQLAYDTINHSHKYDLVPPDEDPILDGLSTSYAINQWNFWWASNEFNWWMGQDKVAAGAVMLLATVLAAGTYLAAEAAGVFVREDFERPADRRVTEAA